MMKISELQYTGSAAALDVYLLLVKAGLRQNNKSTNNLNICLQSVETLLNDACCYATWCTGSSFDSS